MIFLIGDGVGDILRQEHHRRYHHGVRIGIPIVLFGFLCQSIARQSTNSGIRVIYNYLEEDKLIELTYIEIYYKSRPDKNHNVDRLKEY